MPIFNLDHCPKHHLEGTEFTTLATPTHGEAGVRVWQVEIQPGTPSVPHSLTASEVFVVQHGEATATIDGQESDVRAGEVLVVPAHTPFSLSATGTEPFRAVVCFPLEGRAVLHGGEPFTPPWGR